MPERKQKYFLLYLKTGGGHLAPARAVAEYIKKNHNDKDVLLLDGFSDAWRIARFIVEEGYRKVQKNAKWIYEFLYAFYHLPLITTLNDLSLQSSIKPYLERMILTEKPDKIIIFHFFLITPVYKILKKHSLNIKVITVVTDPFTAHPFWFKEKNQEYVVFSERLKQKLIEKNIPENRLHLFPFILNEVFTKRVAPDIIEQLKAKHNISVDKKTVMVFGGGDGIPKGNSIIRKLLDDKVNANIIVVCGKNIPFYKKALRIKKQRKADNIVIFGYVNFINELLNISDVIITKAGASAAMEILSLKKVPIIIDYLWGQELGNVEYIIENNMGIYEKDIEKLPSIVNRLLNDQQYYNSFCTNIEQMQLKSGTPSVSEFLITF